MRVVFTPAAEQDLDDIWFEVAQDSVKNADTVIDRLRDRSQQLSTFPQSAPARHDISAETRALTVGRYLVLYKLADEWVEVVRVVHGARDLANLM